MTSKVKKILFFLFVFSTGFFNVMSQVSFELKTSPEEDFVFNSTSDYVTGITRFNVLKLNVSSDRRWDMWVKATNPNWTIVETYSSNGQVPDIDILELRVRNAASTSLISGFFPITNTEQYLIGTLLSDADVPCPNSGANVAGDYLTNPSCYEFYVDFRLTPGIDPVNYLRSGLYRIEILFTIVEDL